MKTLLILVITLFCSVSYAQDDKKTIASDKIIKDGDTFIQLRNNNDVPLELKIAAGSSLSEKKLLENDFAVYIAQRSPLECYVSAAYKFEDKWIQDYACRSIFFPPTGVNSITIEKIEILDGETFLLNLRIEQEGKKPEKLEKKYIIEQYGFYEPEFDSFTNLSVPPKGKRRVNSIRQNHLIID